MSNKMSKSALCRLYGVPLSLKMRMKMRIFNPIKQLENLFRNLFHKLTHKLVQNNTTKKMCRDDDKNDDKHPHPIIRHHRKPASRANSSIARPLSSFLSRA